MTFSANPFLQFSRKPFPQSRRYANIQTASLSSTWAFVHGVRKGPQALVHKNAHQKKTRKTPVSKRSKVTSAAKWQNRNNLATH